MSKKISKFTIFSHEKPIKKDTLEEVGADSRISLVASSSPRKVVHVDPVVVEHKDNSVTILRQSKTVEIEPREYTVKKSPTKKKAPVIKTKKSFFEDSDEEFDEFNDGFFNLTSSIGSALQQCGHVVKKFSPRDEEHQDQMSLSGTTTVIEGDL